MPDKYLIWDGEFSADFVGFKKPRELARVFFLRGEPLSEKVGSDPIVAEQEPGTGRLVPDFLLTPWSIIVGPGLRGTLDSFGVRGIEYFTLELRSPKGRLLSDQHSILNVTSVIDCIDEAGSEYTVSPFSKQRFQTMSRIEIDSARIPAGILLFRLERYPEVLLAEQNVVEEVRERHSGCKFLTLGEYNEKNKKEW